MEAAAGEPGSPRAAIITLPKKMWVPHAAPATPGSNSRVSKDSGAYTSSSSCCIISGLACSEGSDPEEWRHLAALEACACSEQAVPHTADSSVGTGWSLGRDATMNCHRALGSLQDKFIPSPTGPASGEDARSQGQTNTYSPGWLGIHNPPCTIGVNHCTY